MLKIDTTLLNLYSAIVVIFWESFFVSATCRNYSNIFISLTFLICVSHSKFNVFWNLLVLVLAVVEFFQRKYTFDFETSWILLFFETKKIKLDWPSSIRFHWNFMQLILRLNVFDMVTTFRIWHNGNLHAFLCFWWLFLLMTYSIALILLTSRYLR